MAAYRLFYLKSFSKLPRKPRYATNRIGMVPPKLHLANYDRTVGRTRGSVDASICVRMRALARKLLTRATMNAALGYGQRGRLRGDF
jgi:hypothetical protein